MVTHEFIWLWLSSTIPLKISPFCVSLRIAPNTDRPRLNDLRFVNNRDDFWWHRKYPNEVGASSSGTANEHDGGKYFQSAVTLMYWSHCHSRWIFPLSVYFKIRITLLVSCIQGPIESWLLLLTQSLHIQIVFFGGGGCCCALLKGTKAGNGIEDLIPATLQLWAVPNRFFPSDPGF